ncbi:dpr16 [Drosophila busckii]|uniref:Dpr16 n=1 Tax=Drosophila busckii TaxID=30019 RepID=A0A0M5J4K3_DROBS|nr:mucin-5AC [Drosophila busckii]ALC45781.1 dpr16 [Drosophila busckii]
MLVPQTSPQWRQTGNEHTKDAASVTAARNCATGTATAKTLTTTTATSAKPRTIGEAAAATRSGEGNQLTTAKMKTSVPATGHCQRHRRQFSRTNKAMTWQRVWLPLLILTLSSVVNFGAYLVTCSSVLAESGAESEAEPQPAPLTTHPRSTLPDRPMTTQNDLIRTAPNSTTAKMPTTTTTAATTTSVRGATTTSSVESTVGSMGTSSTAPTIITLPAGTELAQIRATMESTTGLAAVAAKQTATATATATTTTAASTIQTMFISTIYPASATDQQQRGTDLSPQTAAAAAAADEAVPTPAAVVHVAPAMASAGTETDAHNSIQTVTLLTSGERQAPQDENEVEGEESVLLLPHPQMYPANADSLTKGFSIPTFLPPFPVFAAADLPAYRAAAAAAEAAEAAAAAAAAAAAEASSVASETVTLSPEQQRQQMFNEQHSYLAAHRDGQQTRRNLTMPVLNITAQMGNHAYMPCQIHRLSDKPVSWVRIRDGHIISVDESTFIADERFQSIYQEDRDYTWSLQIKYVSALDAGWYECQMATEPKLSAKVHLEVITPKTELIGDQSRFVKAGSKVALHCIVRGTVDPPKYIIWFRGQKKIAESSDEPNGWYTQIDRNIFGSVGDNQNTIGSLIIPFVRKEDSGNYTCQPSNSVSVSVDLHVLSGEYSASAIMSAASKSTHCSTLLLMLLLLMLPLGRQT